MLRPLFQPLSTSGRLRHGRVARGWLLLCVLSCTAATTADAAPPYAGRPTDDVLRDLARTGALQLVYTAELVPADAVVTVEPPAGAAIDVIGRVVEPLGLVPRRVDARTYVLVRRATAASASSSAPAVSASPREEATLESVVVTSSRYLLATDLPDVHTVLGQAELDALPRLAEDALRAVHRLPGAASNGLSGLAHIRGGDTNETLVLFDGLPLYEPFHLRLLQSPASVLDERIIGSLDAYAGGFTAEFGDRMSGIIDARSVRHDADEHYEIGLSLLHANALASRRFADGRGQWLASIRRSNLDEIADVLDSEIGEPSYLDAFARVDYAWSPATRGSVHMLLSRDTAEVENSAGTEAADAEYSNTYLWATLEHDWAERLTTSALVSFTDVDSERKAEVDEPGLSRGRADDRRDYDVLGIKLDASFATERWLQRAGVEVRALSATYDYEGSVLYAPDYPFPGAQSFDRALSPSPSGEHVAVYYTVRGRLGDAVTAEAGLRWDEQTYGDDADDQLGPRLNVAWRLSDRTRLLASWGRFQQFQGIEELPVEDGVDEFERAQHADHAIVGLEHSFGDAFLMRFEAYEKRYGRLRTRYENLYDPLSLAPELRWDRVAIAPDAATAQGLEWLLTWRPEGDWDAWVSYALARVEDRLNGANVRRSWDQTHTVNAGLAWDSGPWTATVVAQYHTGWPVTPIGLDDTGAVVLGDRNDARYAYFASIDARLSHEWLLPRGTLSAHVELTNALDRRNPCCTDLAYDVNDAGTPRLERELRHWLPLVPSVGLLWKF